MHITFIGVGEAFDENQLNTSLLIETTRASLLLDCGFSAPMGFWKAADRPLDLDAIYISHFHGDHFFGIPALLMRMKQEGRTAPLTIMGQPGVEAILSQTLELAYPGSMDTASFELTYVECITGQSRTLGDMSLHFAMSDHSRPCLAVRVDNADGSIFYSGDGRPTDDTAALAEGARLIVHESFNLETSIPGHGTVDGSIDFARRAGARELALVHIDRSLRSQGYEALRRNLRVSQDLHVFVPESGDSVTITPENEAQGFVAPG